MILNHKDAFTFVREHTKEYRTLTRANLEQLHGILVKDLSVGLGLRSKPVGVVGSTYRPLDNIHQIRETVDELSSNIGAKREFRNSKLSIILKLPHPQSKIILLIIMYLNTLLSARGGSASGRKIIFSIIFFSTSIFMLLPQTALPNGTVIAPYRTC